jgi:lipoprotein Spr
MLKKTLTYFPLLIVLASCTGLKTAFSGSKQTASAPAPKKETKFLEGIDVAVETNRSIVTREPEKTVVKKQEETSPHIYPVKKDEEELSSLQVKYSVLLNTPAEEVRNTKMFEFIDTWYGTPYRLGGTTKKGIDCSAFSQFLFSSVYGINLPRTAREQYKLTSRISRTELKEGDLLFFNTRGGVSHVGVYLQNNKFVHASTSGGVMISDVFDQYWVRKFIGVGRLKAEEMMLSSQ